MSYISEISPASLASANTSHDGQFVDRMTLPDVPASSSGKLASGLEMTILLSMLSGLSLTFCLIVAGAF